MAALGRPPSGGIPQARPIANDGPGGQRPARWISSSRPGCLCGERCCCIAEARRHPVQFTDWRNRCGWTNTYDFRQMVGVGRGPDGHGAGASAAVRDFASAENREGRANGPTTFDEERSSAPALACSDHPEDRDHPTQKPVELRRALCPPSSPVGSTILDPFMGRGGWGVRHHWSQVHRNRIDPGYFDIAKRRIQHALAGAGVRTTGAA